MIRILYFPDLESEMYQLSHILSDQKNLIEQIKEESLLDEQKNITTEIADENGDEMQDQNKKALKDIRDALNNYDKSLDGKVFIHEGSFIELDADEYRPICRCHLFLFNDVVIIAKIKHDKKLEFMSEYDTKKIAVVNIKDLTGVRNAINIITSDGPRIYQTINDAARIEWIEKFEIAMKFHQQPTPSNLKVKSKKKPAPQPPSNVEQKSAVVERPIPEWIYTLPEEIHSEIAQRHFEDSLASIQKCEQFLQQNQSFQNSNEICDKLKNLKSVLTNVLLHELSTTKNRDLQSVLRSSRRTLKLLVDMDKSRESSSIFLKVCSIALRTSQKNNRRNNLPVSELFFCDLAQIATEFMRAFLKHEACISALIVWSSDELSYFTKQLIKHFLIKGTTLENIAKIVESVREPCLKLTEIGLDLSYFLEGLIQSHLEMLLEDSRSRLIEGINRGVDESWQPYNLTSKTNLRHFTKDFNEKLDIDLSSYVTGETYISLTQSTIQFCKHYLNVTNSCALIGKNHVLKPLCEKILVDFFVCQHNLKPLSTQQNVDVSKNLLKIIFINYCHYSLILLRRIRSSFMISCFQ